MIQSKKLLARICSLGVVLSIVYVAPLMYASPQTNGQVAESNNKIMIDTHNHTLDVVTINLLHSIENANVLYDSKSLSRNEELILRVRIRDSFEEYYVTLTSIEAEQGLIYTDRAREVVQSAIDEFMELENQYDRTTLIGYDLDNYSRVMTESLINVATTV